MTDESLARDLVKPYYFATQSEMMGRFLDKLHILHKQGRIDGDPLRRARQSLTTAAAELREDFDPSEVDLYINALYLSDPEVWAGLAPAGVDDPARAPNKPSSEEDPNTENNHRAGHHETQKREQSCRRRS